MFFCGRVSILNTLLFRTTRGKIGLEGTKRRILVQLINSDGSFVTYCLIRNRSLVQKCCHISMSDKNMRTMKYHLTFCRTSVCMGERQHWNLRCKGPHFYEKRTTRFLSISSILNGTIKKNDAWRSGTRRINSFVCRLNSSTLNSGATKILCYHRIYGNKYPVYFQMKIAFSYFLCIFCNIKILRFIGGTDKRINYLFLYFLLTQDVERIFLI